MHIGMAQEEIFLLFCVRTLTIYTLRILKLTLYQAPALIYLLIQE